MIPGWKDPQVGQARNKAIIENQLSIWTTETIKFITSKV